MTVTQLKAIMPHAPMAWLIALAEEMPRWNINTPARISAFVGQVAHESTGLTHLDESLYYTDAERVRKMFAHHFDALDVDDAWAFLSQPERFANRVYADRMGNGDEASGDGWRYRGRGPIMRTGKESYAEDAKALGFDLIADPDALTRVPRAGCASSCRFFMVRGCNDLADAGDIEGITHKVNGGYFGLKERAHLTAETLRVLAA